MITPKKLARNTVINMLCFFVNAVVGFFMVPFFLGILKEDVYGIWVLVASIFQYRFMMAGGINSAVNRYIPIYLAKNDEVMLGKVVTTAFSFLLILGLLFSVLVIIIAANFPLIFPNVAPELADKASKLVLIIGLSFSLAFPFQLTNAILSGLQSYHISGSIQLSCILMRTLLAVLLLKKGMGLLTLGMIYGSAELAMRLLPIYYLMAKGFKFRISFVNYDWKFLGEMTTYGINTLLYTLGTLLTYKMCEIVLGMFSTMELVAQFSIVTVCILLISQIIQCFTRALKPAVSDLDARKKDESIVKISLLMWKYVLVFLVPACFFFIFFGEAFLTVWVGDKFDNPSTIRMLSTCLAIMVVGHGLRLAQQSNFVVLVGKGFHQVFGVIALTTAFVCVIATIICVKIMGGNLVSVALANSIPVGIVSLVFLPVYFCKIMQIRFASVYENVLKPAFLSTFGAVMSMLILSRYLVLDSWGRIGGLIVLTALLLAVFGWFWGISAEEKMKIRLLLSKSR